MPAGTLFVVATPIGHLEDISLRALKVLKSVALIAAEDTRRTGNLLRHYEISTPVLSVHAHNEKLRTPRVLARLAAGDSVALVSDAGTPGISDPGETLVAAARNAGFRVEPIPGACAVVTALSATGISSDGFVFLGFPPVRSKPRKTWFDDLVSAARRRAVVFYEAPHRVQRTLAELDKLVDRPIMIARELTKIHEEHRFGTPSELLDVFKNPQGEFTLVIPPGTAHGDSPVARTDEDISLVFGQITDKMTSGTKREAARATAEQLGLTTKQVYDALERVKLGQTP